MDVLLLKSAEKGDMFSMKEHAEREHRNLDGCIRIVYIPDRVTRTARDFATRLRQESSAHIRVLALHLAKKIQIRSQH